MGAWKTEKHLVSWIGLDPDYRISGGKVIQLGTRKVISRAATAFRLAPTRCAGARAREGPVLAHGELRMNAIKE